MQDKIIYLKKVFGRAKLQNNGIDLMVMCPSCGDSNKPNKLKMNIRMDNDLYHCWVCNLKGKNIGRLIKMKRPSMVAGYFEKFSPNSFSNYISDTRLEEIVNLPDGYRLVMSNLHDPSAKQVKRYAASRGITESMLWRYRIGFSDEWKFRNRLLFPSFDCDGNINYWVSRTIEKENKYRYINAKARKEDVVFNEIDLDWNEKSILLVEGPLDLIKCGQYNSTCLLGSSLSEHSLLFQKIVKNSMDVVLALDSDAWKKQLAIAKLFSSFDISVWFASPKTGDIGELTEDSVEHLVQHRVQYREEFGGLEYLIQKI